jgi:ActR/RegA family two-component response regulator
MTLATTRRQITKECDLPGKEDIRRVFAFGENGLRSRFRTRSDCFPRSRFRQTPLEIHLTGQRGACPHVVSGWSGKHRAITGVTLRLAIATVSCDLMAFNALLMCREEKHLRVLGKALDDVGMEQEVCLSAPEALDLTVQRHYSALVIDFDLPGAATVARMARLAPARRRPVIFGMIGALTEIAETFQAGANFIFYKPLGVEQMVRCLRAGRGFMRPDRRNSPRQSLESLVYLQFGVASLPAMVLDLNQNGMALQAPEPLPPVQQVPLRFVLPGTDDMVQGMGEVIWADDGGRAGMLFSRLTPASRKYLKQWFGKRDSKKKTASRAAVRPEKARPAAAGSD